MEGHERTDKMIAGTRSRRAIFLFALGILTILVVVMPIRAMMQDQDDGFSVDSGFSSYYIERGGKEIYGDPISESFVDSETGNVVQYFENARLELGEDFTGGLEVITSSLGMMLGYWEIPLTFIDEKEGCRFFHETGHQVCHAFLEYYEEHGSSEVFGYPISEFKFIDGRIVQYYQRFRLDWFADEEDQPVKPGPLGKLHLSMLDRLSLKSDSDPIVEVEGLIIKSSVGQSSTRRSDSQTIYLLVQDQNQVPLAGAAATLIAHFPDGDRMIVLPLTDNDGRSQISFDFNDQPSGFRVSLDITVVYQGLTKETRESFMIYLHNSN
jgi:hypothetical protein